MEAIGIGDLRIWQNRGEKLELRRVLLVGLGMAMAATIAAAAQTPKASGVDSDNPVAQVRNHMSWELGPEANWGIGLGNRDTFQFFWTGFQVGKVLTPVVHAGRFSGQFELGGNINPLWLGFTPPPHVAGYTCDGVPCQLPTGGGTFHGVSLTPLILRWNFLTHSPRIQPWFQAAGGLIYTTHKYPPNYLSNPAKGLDGGTSVWNFAPQGGFGVHYFLRPKRSIDFGVNAVHISSSSLGDRNPGVNASIQIQAGYTFWK